VTAEIAIQGMPSFSASAMAARVFSSS